MCWQSTHGLDCTIVRADNRQAVVVVEGVVVLLVGWLVQGSAGVRAPTGHAHFRQSSNGTLGHADHRTSHSTIPIPMDDQASPNDCVHTTQLGLRVDEGV
jgi:hypothetical protein